MSAAAEPSGVLQKELAQQIQDLAVPAGGSWWVGLSGGLDSTVLLHLLKHHCAGQQDPPRLTALYVNHQMQPDAAHWQAHCARLCDALEVQFCAEMVQVSTTASPEAAARDARYAAFKRCLAPGDALFLAHHRDDQVETMLLRLLRGSGPRGLSGMPRHRPLGKAELYRPLLGVSRETLRDYAESAGLGWVEDASNDDNRHDRNFLRNAVLPLLESRWPAYRNTLARAGELIDEQERLLASLQGQPETRSNRFGEIGLPLSQLHLDDISLAAGRVRTFLNARGASAPSRRALSEFLRQLASEAGRKGARLETGSWVLQVYDSAIWLLAALPPAPADWSASIETGRTLELDWLGRLTLEPDPAGPLSLREGEVLTLRLRQGGEKMSTPAGQRSVKKLLQEARIAPWWRNRLPLLFHGAELLAVADVAARKGVPQGGSTGWRLQWETPETN